MLKQKPERITYAQQKLIQLIEERKLRRWCLDNGIMHSSAYRLALGEQTPTYKIIASTCHLISPIEWLFFTDEKLPYEPVLIPKWDSEKPSKYVKAHHFDYLTVAKKYNLESISAYNIFVSYRAKPTPLFIRAVCNEVNPIDFFTDGETEITNLREFVPERGDIVSVEGKIIFVITKQKLNEKNKSFSGCVIISENEKGIELKKSITKGFVCPYKLSSFNIEMTTPRTLIEKAEEGIVKKVLDKVYKELQ